jgi:CBS domain-containing protein
MYDIYDDELKAMYESTGKPGITLDKGISPSDPLSTLTQEKFIVLNEQATLRDAIDSMQKYHIGCILLENNHKITGIFTERDIVQQIVGNRHNLEKECVENYMTKSPDVLHLQDPIAFALNKMIAGGYRHIPIVDKKEKPIGIITMQDIINHLGDYFFDDIVNLPHTPLRDQTQREGG